ncbi:MAG: tetratricopeptide repeat protein [Selenomonadaceae bacterium]|nr:tetratricopeptide repeat protein [Selenomonadaceae bacterium]MEE1361706.1 tetratricopeptide repeat protein [Selenomonadaceae bacterium]
MNEERFQDLVEYVQSTSANPPEHLFSGGYEDWHCRARLAQFLSMEGIDKTDEAIELFKSIEDIEPDEENSQDIEEKIYALQKLSHLYKEKKEFNEAMTYICNAIELAESTDYLYRYILRGELWADRWNLMHHMKNTAEAEAEVDNRIEVYKDIPIEHNSYLYYGYRFKAQLAAERGVTLVAKDFMHMALHNMEIPEGYQERLDEAFKAEHDNASWIMAEIDKATPDPNKLEWDI